MKIPPSQFHSDAASPSATGWRIVGALSLGVVLSCLVWFGLVVVFERAIMVGPILVAVGVSLPARIWARQSGDFVALVGFTVVAMVSLVMFAMQQAVLMVLLPNNEFSMRHIDVAQGFEYLLYGLSFWDFMVWLFALALTHVMVLWRIQGASLKN
jgi:hypothetical protein